MSYDQPFPAEQGNTASSDNAPASIEPLMSRVGAVEHALKQHVSEFQRFQEFFAQQMKAHTVNAENALDKHVESSAAFHKMSAAFEKLSQGLAQDVAVIKSKLSTLA